MAGRRLAEVSNANTRFVRVWCLEVHDLAVAKLVAGREKDIDFVISLRNHGMAQPEVLRMRLAETELDLRVQDLSASRIEGCFRE